MVSRHERRGDEPARDSDDTLDLRNVITPTIFFFDGMFPWIETQDASARGT
jgi:hypothetical protein